MNCCKSVRPRTRSSVSIWLGTLIPSWHDHGSDWQTYVIVYYNNEWCIMYIYIYTCTCVFGILQIQKYTVYSVDITVFVSMLNFQIYVVSVYNMYGTTNSNNVHVWRILLRRAWFPAPHGMIAILYWMYCLPKNNISSYTLENNYIVPLYPKLASLLAFHCISCAKYNLLATLFLVLPWQHVPFWFCSILILICKNAPTIEHASNIPSFITVKPWITCIHCSRRWSLLITSIFYWFLLKCFRCF